MSGQGSPRGFDAISSSCDAPDPGLQIAIVNNMPDAALAATERQFRHLLQRASGERRISISIFVMPEIPRGDVGERYCALHARPMHELLAGRFDALIVTGCEPRAGSLKDEPFWGSFERLIDWAKTNTASAVWSCLAAHAAVLYLDGIARQRLPTKLSGVFDCWKASEHPLLDGMNERIAVPHSRLNGLDRDHLVRAGYEILTNSDIGVDSFAKRYPSLFVFLQGHPEYAGDTLGREYRRDVERFFAGKAESLPEVPLDYFEHDLERSLAAFASEARGNQTMGLMTELPFSAAMLPQQGRWHESAIQFYSNWLTLVAAYAWPRLFDEVRP